MARRASSTEAALTTRGAPRAQNSLASQEPSSCASFEMSTPSAGETSPTRDADTGLTVGIANRTAEVVIIEWDRCSLVDATGQAHRVVREVVPLGSHEQPQAPTTVPPGAHVVETVFPADAVEYRDGRWRRRLFLPANDAEARGFEFTLVLAVNIENRTMTVRRRMRVTDFKVEDHVEDKEY